MPRQEHLENLTPNRLYSLNATVKYLHRGEKSLTGIIEQNNTQSKVCIRDENITLGQGYDYSFKKCFYSSNGWIYVRQPNLTIQRNEQSPVRQPMQLQYIFQHRNQLTGQYITVGLYVVQIHPTQVFMKNQQQLRLTKMTCFGNGVLIDIIFWNKNIPMEYANRWVVFDGVKIKYSGPDSMSITSSVYTKFQCIGTPQVQQYDPTQTYKNLSSLYQSRTIAQMTALSQYHEKVHSIIQGSIVDLTQTTYQGCATCKRKVTENNCSQCGTGVIVNIYTILNVGISDNDSFIKASVFDSQLQQKLKLWNMQSPVVFTVYLKTKIRTEAEILIPSHVITKLEPTIF